MLLAASYGDSDGSESAEEAAPQQITCNLAYRTAPSEIPEEQPALTLAPGDMIERVSFDDLALEATYSIDEFEGATVFIDVFVGDEPSALSRTLYQLSLGKPLQNQFVGGHGFTGLVYVRAPTSGAELQYWCTANEER